MFDYRDIIKLIEIRMIGLLVQVIVNSVNYLYTLWYRHLLGASTLLPLWNSVKTNIFTFL